MSVPDATPAMKDPIAAPHAHTAPYSSKKESNNIPYIGDSTVLEALLSAHTAVYY